MDKKNTRTESLKKASLASHAQNFRDIKGPGPGLGVLLTFNCTGTGSSGSGSGSRVRVWVVNA